MVRLGYLYALSSEIKPLIIIITTSYPRKLYIPRCGRMTTHIRTHQRFVSSIRNIEKTITVLADKAVCGRTEKIIFD